MPMFVSAIDGFIINGPMRTRALSGSGPPSPICACAGVPVVRSPSTTTTAERVVLNRIYLVPLFGSDGPK